MSKYTDILIIDDNSEIIELIDRTLRGTEFNIKSATSGRAGIAIAKNVLPGAILLDIQMPDFDGFMTSKVLKRNEKTKHIPILFLTGNKSKDDINRALLSGGVDYIVKPFSPSDLLNRLRKTINSKGEVNTVATNKKNHVIDKNQDINTQEPVKLPKSRISVFSKNNVIVMTTEETELTIQNTHVYRGLFANIVAAGQYKIVFDTSCLSWIDAAGLGLLISVDEALKENNGELKVTYITKEVNSRFNFVNVSELFNSYPTYHEAVNSFTEEKDTKSVKRQLSDVNVCLTCTYVNNAEARFCSYCGTNLILGKGERILYSLKVHMSRKLLSESGNSEIDAINKAQNITLETRTIPSEFAIDLSINGSTISYLSKKTDARFLETEEIIGLEYPGYFDIANILKKGLSVNISNPRLGIYSKFKTEVTDFFPDKRMMYVKYSMDAAALHSQKNFSVTPLVPFEATFTIPTLYNAGTFYSGKVIDISRLRMIIYSESAIPVNTCLALKFHLPTGPEISSPFVVAGTGIQPFTYDIEFVAINDRESAHITQYMYKRQIEQAKIESKTE